MSKSIYDEALEAYGHVNAIVQNKKSHLTWEQEVHHLANITRALQQVQKQEKLLGLYKELIEVKNDMLSFVVVDGDYYDLEKIETGLEKQIDEIEKQISEIENEN